jgi:hypothetical protein
MGGGFIDALYEETCWLSKWAAPWFPRSSHEPLKPRANMQRRAWTSMVNVATWRPSGLPDRGRRVFGVPAGNRLATLLTSREEFVHKICPCPKQSKARPPGSGVQ